MQWPIFDHLLFFIQAVQSFIFPVKKIFRCQVYVTFKAKEQHSKPVDQLEYILSKCLAKVICATVFIHTEYMRSLKTYHPLTIHEEIAA